MKLEIIKSNGNGNDFIIIDKNDLPNNCKINSETIKQICFSHDNTDGLVIINRIKKNEYEMDYYNNDGSWETLCVNALRCVGLLIYKKLGENIISVHCGDGIHEVETISNNCIKVSMEIPTYKTDKITFYGLSGYYIFSGAKHFVIEYKKSWPDRKKIEEIAKKIRYNKFFTNGINVNFYKILDKNTIEVKTYEKGVEKMMSSCASGSFACAFHVFQKDKINNNFIIMNEGGNSSIIFEDSRHLFIGNAEIEYSKMIDFNQFLN